MENTITAPQTLPKYAGFGRRFVAYWIDSLILFLIFFVVQQMLGKNPLAVFEAQTMADVQKLQSNDSTTTLILYGLAFIFYLIMWVNFDGATPGKKLMAIKITRGDGSKLNYAVAIIRILGYLLSSFVLMLGFIWILFDKKKQGWHDKIANTVVIETNEKPKIFAGILLMMISVLCLFGFMGSALLHGFRIGFEEAAKKSSTMNSASSVEEIKNNLSVKSKPHYLKSQELFTQLRTAGDNIDAIQPIADQIIAEAKLAAEAEPSNAFLWSNLADAYTWPNTLGTAEDSLNAYKKAEDLDPNNVIYINFVGDQLLNMKRYDESILQFQKTLRLTERSGFAHLSLGKAYTGLKIYNEAKTNFEKAIELFKSQNNKGQFDDEILAAQKWSSSLPK